MTAAPLTREAYWAPRRTESSAEFRAARDLLLAHRDDHAAAVSAFQWPRFESFNWALEWFDVVAEDNHAPALELLDGKGGSTTVTYSRLSVRSDAVAVWLREQGVARGDRVLLVLGTQVELWECLLACLKLGAVVVPTYPSLTAAEAADRVARGGIRHVICRAGVTDRFAGVAVPGLRICVPAGVSGWLDYTASESVLPLFVPDGPTPGSDVAFGYFTSGTTAAPKLVTHTHTSYPVGHLSSLYWQGLRPGDRHLNVSAPGWAKHSWSSFFVPWNAEAVILALPDGFAGFDRLPSLLASHRAVSFCAPPSTWHALRPHLGSAKPSLREATAAGEPLEAGLAAEVAAAWGVTVRDGYGQTETTALIGTTPGLAPKPGWLGLPLPGYRISLRDPETGAVGCYGEVCVELDPRPVGVMAGYADDAERTARAVGGDWYATGDLGESDMDGYVRVIGRRDDVFKSFDHRVSPYELEACLRSHPAVAEVAVVPQPHPVGGAVPCAVVVPAAGFAPEPALASELLTYAASLLAPEVRPRSVRFTASLPRTVSGKVRRADLTSAKGDPP